MGVSKCTMRVLITSAFVLAATCQDEGWMTPESSSSPTSPPSSPASPPPSSPSLRYNCPMWDYDFYGHDLNSVSGITEWTSCGEICGLVDGCKYWTLNTELNRCWLKGSGSGLMSKPNAISGVKACQSLFD